MGTTSGSVNSRWWYWIAAYPIAFLVVIPVLVVLGLLIAIPVALLGIGIGAPPFLTLLGVLVAGLVLFALSIGLIAIFVVLPFALYFDATAVREADVPWSPDPTVFALLAALQFVVTPIVGLVVSVYYLYRRHVDLG